VQVPEDKTFLLQLLRPVAHRGAIHTPGFRWSRVSALNLVEKFAIESRCWNKVSALILMEE
jgi:hypothetical protein